MDVLVGFCVNLTQTSSYLGKEDLNWENDSIRLAYRQACGVFSWLMVGVEALSSLLEVPILERWSHGEQARKAAFFQGLCFSACQLPFIMDYSCNLIQIFSFPSCFSSQCFITSIKPSEDSKCEDVYVLWVVCTHPSKIHMPEHESLGEDVQTWLLGGNWTGRTPLLLDGIHALIRSFRALLNFHFSCHVRTLTLSLLSFSLWETQQGAGPGNREDPSADTQTPSGTLMLAF